MLDLLNDLMVAFQRMTIAYGELSTLLEVDENGEYMKDKAAGYEKASQKDIIKGIWNQPDEIHRLLSEVICRKKDIQYDLKLKERRISG